MSRTVPLLSGTLDLILLQLLRAQPTNGYDLTLRIRAISSQVLQVNAGSLYPALYRLEERGLVRSRWEATEKGRRARVYALTRAGERELERERKIWERFAGALHAILQIG